MALKQGVVDAQENPLSVIFHNKYYEAQKHLALTNHVYNALVHVMSKKIWDKPDPRPAEDHQGRKQESRRLDARAVRTSRMPGSSRISKTRA